LLRKLIRLLWSSSTILVFLASCSSGTAAAPTPQPTLSPEPPAARRSPLVLTVWHSWSGRSAQALDLAARRYEQRHSSVRISLQSRPASALIRDYSTAVADESGPQILLIHGRYLGELAERRYVLPLRDEDVAETLKNLLPPAVEGSRVSGVLHGLPISFDSLLFFFDRRQMVEPPKTLEALQSAPTPQATTTSERMWRMAYYLSPATTLPYMYAFDGGLFRGKAGNVDESRRDGTIRWLEWLQSLRADERLVASDDFGSVDAAIQSSRVSSAIDWSFRLPNYQRLWGDEAVGLGSLPRAHGDAPAPRTLVLSDVACINTVTSAEHRAAALDFVVYLASPAAQEILWSRGGYFPVNQQARVDEPAKVVREMAAGGIPFPNSPRSTRSWPGLDEMVRSVLSGSATPNEALEKVLAATRSGQ